LKTSHPGLTREAAPRRGGITSDQLREENIEIVRRFLGAINDSWNIEAMRELVSDDVLFVIPFAPEWFPVHHEGRDAVLAFMDSVRHIMYPENLHDLVLDTLATDPGEVVAVYKSDTRIRATNLPYRNTYIGRFTVRSGKITYFGEHLDPIRYVLAIGGRVEPPAGWPAPEAP
jgi:uncharacterized protein